MASRSSRTLLRRNIFDDSVWYDDAASTPAIRALAMPKLIPGDPGFAARSELSFRYRRFTISGMNVWTWDGSWVLRVERSWVRVSPEGWRRVLQAGMDMPREALDYTVPPGVLPLVLAARGWLWWK